MAAPKGNQFWKQRSRHGNKPNFDCPQKLAEACEDYFEWVEANPLWEDKIGFYEGSAVHTDGYKMRAMTIEGLCIFIDVSVNTWKHWRAERKDLLSVIEWAQNVIREQKYTGAAAGLLNSNIVARDLGLMERSHIENQFLDAQGKKTNPPGSVDEATQKKLESYAEAIEKFGQSDKDGEI